MGIIKKQSITGTIYLYIGVLLGFVTTGIVFPNVLTTEEVGLLRLLVSVALMVSQFAGLGFQSPTARLFSFFRNKDNGHNGFLTLSLVVSFSGFILFVTALFLMKPWVVSTYEERSVLFVQYFNFIFPLILFKLLFNTFDNYYKVLYNAVIGAALKEIWQRVFILISVLAYYFKLVDFDVLVACYVISIGLPALIIIVSLIKEKEFTVSWNKGFIDPEMRRSLIDMSVLGLLNSFSGIMILNVDILMINHILGLGNTGVYAITMYFGTLVSMPARSIRNISSVVIADAWKENKRELISEIYSKSCIVLTAIGMLLYIGLLANIDNIFRIIGSQYEAGQYVVVFIGLACIFDMSSGVSKVVLNTSSYYRYLTWSIVLLFLLIVSTNLIMIGYFRNTFGEQYGIVGAAFASALSKLIYNLVVYLFLWRKFSFQPFNYKYLILIAIAVVSYFASTLLNPLDSLVFDIIGRSAIVAIIFLTLTYLFRISTDINEVINLTISKLTHRNKE